MKNPIESLLQDDHEAVGVLLTDLDAELKKPDLARSLQLLDLFWARLAVHIRAEHLHLFPAVTNASASLFTRSGRLPTYEEAQTVIARLRADHDFFMKELALLIRNMRELVRGKPALGPIEDLRQRLSTIAKRLAVHNRLEEDQVYAWPLLLFDEQTVVALIGRLQGELDHAPPRFAGSFDSLPE